jgi:hypothetical protein
MSSMLPPPESMRRMVYWRLVLSSSSTCSADSTKGMRALTNLTVPTKR